MTDIPAEMGGEPRQQSPGERYEMLAGILAEMLALCGVNLTSRGQEALAVLIQEALPQWQKAKSRIELAVNIVKRLEAL